MPKEPETNSTAEETAEIDAEFERQLAATLSMDPVERVKRLETMSEQLEKDLENLSWFATVNPQTAALRGH
ncbi:GTPase [uncultured Rothia sp.]|uniref:GTPase n=1 Tax=uncultured Rothia sp. TaxID=316088 RepID=UPI0025DE208E|nr:GTPase [uncultured Rothia sp.]